MIKGKIVKILSETDVILDVGEKDVVTEDMEFVIYNESEDILDPETQENLGTLETVKGRLRITHVMERMCRATTTTYQATTPSIASFMLTSERTETRKRKLKVEESDITPINEDMIVKVGDLVRSV